MDNSSEVINSGRVKCDACSEENKSFQSATEYCEDCDENLCDNCVRAHRKVKLAKSHRLVPLQKDNDSTSKKDNDSTTEKDNNSESQIDSDSASNKDNGSASVKDNDSTRDEDNDSATGKDHNTVSNNDDDSVTEQDNDSDSENGSTSDIRYCESHEGQVVKLFCVECDICVCEACVASEHKSHGLGEFEEISSKLRKQISESVTELEKAIIVVKQNAKKAKKMQNISERKLKQNKDKIQHHCQEVRNLIDKFEAELLNETESCIEADVSKNRKQIEESEYRSAQIESYVRFLVAVKENGGNEEIALNGKEFLTRAEQLILSVSELLSTKCESTCVDFIPSKDKIIEKNIIGRIFCGSVSTTETKTKVQVEISKYNPKDFDLSPKGARFFVVKSYTVEGVQQSIKGGVWGSTEYGNKRLDQAFRERKGKGPLYLFFSVNGSGKFCGMAQMMSAVDYKQQLFWTAKGKQKGTFDVKWIYVKDVSNDELRHIKLENNEGKPVTNSRDTQEILGEKALQVLRIMHGYKHSSTIVDGLELDEPKKASVIDDDYAQNSQKRNDARKKKNKQENGTLKPENGTLTVDSNKSTPELQAAAPSSTPYHLPLHYGQLPNQHLMAALPQYRFNSAGQPMMGAQLQYMANPSGQPMTGTPLPLQYKVSHAGHPLFIAPAQYRYNSLGQPMLIATPQYKISSPPLLGAIPQYKFNPAQRAAYDVLSQEAQIRPAKVSDITKLAPLTAAMLSAAPPHEQKQLLGERLFPLISNMYPDLAGKITGMLLEIDNSELLHMLETREILSIKVEEAVAVLRAHQTKPS